MVGSPLQHFVAIEKEKKEESFHKVCMDTLSYGHSPLTYVHWYVYFFQQPLK